MRDRLCEAALREFLRNGYAGSSIEGIARASGVSRTTVYALYSDKAGLFGGMLRKYVSGAELGRYVAFDDRPPAIVLGDALRVLNRFYHREPNLRLLRLCSGEAERFPELIKPMHDVLSNTLTDLTTYLVRLRDAGRLRIDDCDVATRLFNVMALGTLSPFFLSPERLTDHNRTGHLTMALGIFLRGVLRDPPAEPTD